MGLKTQPMCVGLFLGAISAYILIGPPPQVTPVNAAEGGVLL